MQYLFRLVCDEVEDFRCDILINDDATFLDLHRVIIEACHYPDDQMTSFYLCNEDWERGEQVTREDMSDSTSADQDLYPMEGTTLESLLSRSSRQLEYVFDPFSDRCFSLLLRDEQPGSSAPTIVKSIGSAPPQIAEVNLSDAALVGGSLSADYTDDFGIDSFNSDEIDLEGFEISDGDF